MKILLKINFVVLLLLLPSGFFHQRGQSMVTAASNIQTEEWAFCHNCDFPVWIALNSSPGSALVPRRKIYLLIQNSDFTEANLRKVFNKFATEYAEPQTLDMVAFSDKRKLDCSIKGNTQPVRITREDEEAREECYKQLAQSKTGYFRAYYFRSDNGEEVFQYTADPHVDRFISIKLSGRKDEDYGTDINSNLRLAASKSDIHKLKEMLTQGADVNSADWQGYTALMQAMRPEIASFLLEQGAEIDARNLYGLTALIEAADKGRGTIVELLINSGASIDLRDRYGYTALMRASMEGHASVVVILLKKGANASLVDDFGRTAMALAREKDRPEVIQRFKAAGILK